MLTKKFLTKLLNDNFRNRILEKNNKIINSTYKISQYARYVVDSTIIHRSKEFSNDKTAYYGFSPIECLAACMKDGSIKKNMFEFNTVNHFLREKNGEKAIEVVKCILSEMVRENKNIVDFDIDKIDAEFKKIEKEYFEQEKLKQEKKEQEKKEKNNDN